MKTEIFLIRHGLPELQNALLGSTDSALSELGWSQLDNSAKQLADLDLVISSPLIRCAKFAQDYAIKNQLPFYINTQWKECDFGDWDGVSYQALQDNDSDALSLFFNDPYHHCPPKGESLEKFNRRIKHALDQLLADFQGKRIALFCHAGVIRTLVAWCLKMDLTSGLQFKSFAVDYASITHLSVYHAEKNQNEMAEIFPLLKALNITPSQPPPSQGEEPKYRNEKVPSPAKGRARVG